MTEKNTENKMNKKTTERYNEQNKPKFFENSISSVPLGSHSF